MKSSQLIGKILLTFFSGTIVFVGFLYYLGATASEQPVVETLVDGQWVRDRINHDEYPGDVRLLDEGTYSNAQPLFITGEAQSAWFTEIRTPAEIIAPDGTKLWDGSIVTDERYLYNMIVPFYAEAEIGDYVGDATFVIYTVAYSEENPDEPTRQYSYSANIIIADSENQNN